MSRDVPLATITRMLDAIRDRRVDTVVESFDPGPDTYVFLEGPRWTNRGGESVRRGWRAYFRAPIRLRSWSWSDGPLVHESGDLAVVAGVLDCDFQADGAPRPLRMRMTWGLRRDAAGWRIVHEHGSQPLADPYGTGDWLPDAAAEQVRPEPPARHGAPG